MSSTADLQFCLQVLAAEGYPMTGSYWWILDPLRGLEEHYKMVENTKATFGFDGGTTIWNEWVTTNSGGVYELFLLVDPRFP